MRSIHIEMPSGAASRNVDYKTDELARAAFDKMANQMQTWDNFSATIIMTEEGIEVERREV